MKRGPGKNLVEMIICGAHAHGLESEAEMQVGDLEAALRMACAMLTPAQKAELKLNPEITEILEWRDR